MHLFYKTVAVMQHPMRESQSLHSGVLAPLLCPAVAFNSQSIHFKPQSIVCCELLFKVPILYHVVANCVGMSIHMNKTGSQHEIDRSGTTDITNTNLC